MKKEGYYSSGDFARKAHITKKTIRYYDEHGILKPSYVNENGARFYTDNDFARLQQILFLKYLSFSLDDIKQMTVRNEDKAFWEKSLRMQTNLIAQQMDHLEMMKKAVEEAQTAITAGEEVNWTSMLDLVSQNEMEQKLKNQYLTSSNIEARISLHRDYSQNKQGWFPWLFDLAAIRPGEKILELGSGSGAFWLENIDRIPEGCDITITDISEGMVRTLKEAWEEARVEQEKTRAEQTGNRSGQEMTGSAIKGDRSGQKRDSQGQKITCPQFAVMDAHAINAADRTYDLVIANHLLFYCEDIKKVCAEIRRVLKKGGRVVCSTYGAGHMKEVTQLVQEFDDRIVLSAEKLYEKFGKENGKEILTSYFNEIEWQQYEDRLLVDSPEPLVDYILSCHGNQNRYIVDRYHEFMGFVKKKTDRGFKITKDAGAFVGYADKKE